MLRPFVKYADFSGRASRSEYWMFMLFQGLVYTALTAFFIVSLAEGRQGWGGIGVTVMLAALVYLGCFLPNLAVLVRRLHDIGRSAWWLCLYLPSFLSGFESSRQAMALLKGAQGGADMSSGLVNTLAAQAQPNLLALLAPLCGLIMFVFTVLPGTKGGNPFGSDPTQLDLDLSVFDAPHPAPEATLDLAPAAPQPAPMAARHAERPAARPATAQTFGNPARQAPVFGKRL